MAFVIEHRTPPDEICPDEPRHRYLPVAHPRISPLLCLPVLLAVSMASELSPDARELALVGKLELRIGLANSDKKLEDLLKLYLAPLLLKLGSDSAAVRNKVSLLSTLSLLPEYR